MKVVEFADLTTSEMSDQLKAWTDEGVDPDGFDEFALDFVDRVVFPFSPDSKFEKYTDWFISIAGPMAMDEVRAIPLRWLSFVTDAKPLKALEEKLPG